MILRGSLAAIALTIVAAMACVRLAPVDAAKWHVRPHSIVPEAAGWRSWTLNPPAATPGAVPMPGGAYALEIIGGTVASEVLRRIDAIARATPRTTVLAGTPESGLMTWETRSLLWGFPDYITAEALQDGLFVRLSLVARSRFGDNDLGVNAKRLSYWLLQL